MTLKVAGDPIDDDDSEPEIKGGSNLHGKSLILIQKVKVWLNSLIPST